MIGFEHYYLKILRNVEKCLAVLMILIFFFFEISNFSESSYRKCIFTFLPVTLNIMEDVPHYFSGVQTLAEEKILFSRKN